MHTNLPGPLWHPPVSCGDDDAIAPNSLVVQTDIGKHTARGCVDVEVLQKGEGLGERGGLNCENQERLAQETRYIHHIGAI